MSTAQTSDLSKPYVYLNSFVLSFWPTLLAVHKSKIKLFEMHV
jgi:hypothetical protein